MPRLRVEAAQTARPQIVFLTSAQGTDMTTWRPTPGDLIASELPYQHEPLAAYLDNLLILDGIYNIGGVRTDSEGTPPNGGHEAVGATLTGTAVRVVDDVLVANGPSVDEIIAQGLAARAAASGLAPAPIPALRIGMAKSPHTDPIPDAPGSTTSVNAFHWLDQHVSAPVHWGPWYAYEAIFSEGGDAETLARLRAERRSVLDALSGEVNRVRAELPEQDRDHLDAHLDGIRKLEQGLDNLVECTPPEIGESPSGFNQWTSGPYDDAIVTSTLGLMATALSCGMTDVACYKIRGQEGRARMLLHDPQYADAYTDDDDLDYHALAHRMPASNMDYDATPEERAFSRQAYADIWHWTGRRIKEGFLDVLPDHVRDNLIVVYLSEMSEGGTHSNYNVPLTIFQGSSVGYFQTGKAFRWGGFDVFDAAKPSDDPGEPITKLLVSLCHAVGMHDVTSVGDAAYPQGALQEVMA